MILVSQAKMFEKQFHALNAISKFYKNQGWYYEHNVSPEEYEEFKDIYE